MKTIKCFLDTESHPYSFDRIIGLDQIMPSDLKNDRFISFNTNNSDYTVTAYYFNGSYCIEYDQNNIDSEKFYGFSDLLKRLDQIIK